MSPAPDRAWIRQAPPRLTFWFDQILVAAAQGVAQAALRSSAFSSFFHRFPLDFIFMDHGYGVEERILALPVREAGLIISFTI
jgi:hypothetical protein